jgi:hypothetical protein
MLLFAALLGLALAGPAQAQMGGQLSGRQTAPPPAAAEPGNADAGDAEASDAEVGDAELGDAEVGDAEAHDSKASAPDQLAEEAPASSAKSANDNSGWVEPAEPVTMHMVKVLAGTALGAAAGALVVGVAQVGFLASSIGAVALPLYNTMELTIFFGAAFFLVALTTPLAVGVGAAAGSFLAGGKLWWATPFAGVVAAAAALPVGGFLGAAAGFAAGMSFERSQGGIQTGWPALFFAISALPVGALVISGLVGSVAAAGAASFELLTPMVWKDVSYGDE